MMCGVTDGKSCMEKRNVNVLKNLKLFVFETTNICLSGHSHGFLTAGTAVILRTGEKEEDLYLHHHPTYRHRHPLFSPTVFQQPEHVSVCHHKISSFAYYSIEFV